MDEADALSPRAARVSSCGPANGVDGSRCATPSGTLPGAMAWAEPLSAKCWEYEAMMLREQHVAIPLVANDEMIAVLVLDALRGVEPTRRAGAAQPARPAGRAAPGGPALRPGP